MPKGSTAQLVSVTQGGMHDTEAQTLPQVARAAALGQEPGGLA